jgi:hypothetical protein
VGAVTVISYPTIEHVAMEARPYPTHLLENARTGLILFSAAFLGHNDAIHFALEDVETTCVDINAERLEEMSRLYPDDWVFVCRDAWEFAAERAAAGDKWDVVSADSFLGNATDKSLMSLELWCSVAGRALTATLPVGADYDVPVGWTADTFVRNSNVLWLVLTRD